MWNNPFKFFGICTVYTIWIHCDVCMYSISALWNWNCFSTNCVTVYKVLKLWRPWVLVVTTFTDLPLTTFVSFSPSVEFELRREIRRLQEYRKAGIKSFCSESTLTFSLLCSTKLHFQVAWLSRKCIYIQSWAVLSSLVWVWLLSVWIIVIIICSRSRSRVCLLFRSVFL